ncbi:MAG: SIR2 family protein [Thermodesulfobacteriota bacterium]
MTTDNQSSQVIFFLGAGASVAADVPDTYSFVKEFIDSIQDRDKRRTIEKIVQILRNWKNSDIDVELLLETLTKLENKEQEPLLPFYQGGDFVLKGYFEKEPLINDLKDFIKTKAIVSEEKIRYLQPLLSFVEEFRPLDVISVNYDTCIEQFCNVHKLVYQDGFDVHWNPKTFATEHTDVRLYKLHGSVMWYQSDRGGYIKLLVMTKTSKIELITGEKAENLMLYPMQKWDYAEPLLELLVYIKQLLESETCKFLIVVGYSFRDDHIKRILWDAARKNRGLHLILVGPKTYEIYSEKLKFYDVHSRISSSLDGRVVCLPYRFEEALPYLKNHFLKNLREGLSNMHAQQQAEIRGEKAFWMSCLRSFANAEYTEKVEDLLKRVNAIELERDWQLSLELPLKMTFNLLSNNQEQKANQYLKDFNKLLYIMTVERINVNLMRDPPVIEVNFNYQRHNSGTGYIRAEQFKKVIETLSEFCETRTSFFNHSGNEFHKITEKLTKLKRYFEPFKEERGIKFEEYVSLRESKIPNVEQFRNGYKEFQQGYSQQLHENLASTVVEAERSILKETIKEE